MSRMTQPSSELNILASIPLIKYEAEFSASVVEPCACHCPTAGASHHSRQINMLTRRNVILGFIRIWTVRTKTIMLFGQSHFSLKYTKDLKLFRYPNKGLLKCPLTLEYQPIYFFPAITLWSLEKFCCQLTSVTDGEREYNKEVSRR